MKQRKTFVRTGLEGQLWNVVLEAAGQMEIDSATKQRLREAIEVGVDRMSESDRLSDADISLAKDALRRLVALMMHHASLLDQPEHLSAESFDRAGQALDAVQLGFALWPFWPLPKAKSDQAISGQLRPLA
jgi:hypothetical protein